LADLLPEPSEETFDQQSFKLSPLSTAVPSRAVPERNWPKDEGQEVSSLDEALQHNIKISSLINVIDVSEELLVQENANE
jgi:hypothetical protein